VDPRLGRQRLQVRCVDFLEQLAARLAELAQHALLVEVGDALGDRDVELGQAVEDPVAQPAQQPAFDDADAGLHFRFIPRLPRPRREHRRAIMARHVGVAAVDHRVEVTGLDHRDLGVVRDQQLGHATEEGEGGVVALDPVGQLLGPGRTGEG